MYRGDTGSYSIGYNRCREWSLGPFRVVPVDGLFSKESTTGLSSKHMLFERYLDH